MLHIHTHTRPYRSLTMAKEQELEDLRKSKDTLEAQLASTKKELDRYRSEAERLSVKFSALSSDFSEMSQKFTTSQRLRVTAETEVSGLRKEIEDLSSALFSEANEMVSTARKSENDYKQKNRHLQNEIEEKDLMIETYKQQLNQLKDILETLDKKSSSNEGNNKQSGTASPQKNDLGSNTSSENESLNNNPDSQESHSSNSRSSSNNDLILSNILYAPPVQSLRYDLELFNFFLSFAKHASFLVDSTNTNDYSDIKETRFYKRILHDDIQPTLRLDTAPGVSFLQKRSLMSAIVNGRVIIEPISSVNESFKRNSGIASAAAVSSRPIATPDPCSICGEGRNDALEHARLYMLKIYSSKSQKNKTKPGSSTNLASANNNNSSSTSVNDISGSSTPISSNTATEFTYTFPLCAYCVFRIRSTCELYAFLRSIKSGVWKFNNEVNQKKAWIECTRIRLKMFWSRQGIWDSDSKIVDNKVFSAAQIIGDNFINGNINNSITNRGPNSPNVGSFQFQEKKQTPENYRHSYAGTIGSYMEKYGFSVSSPQKETVPEVAAAPQEPISLENPEPFKVNNVETAIQENEENSEKQQHQFGLNSEATESSDGKNVLQKSIQSDVSGKALSVNNNSNKETIDADEDAGSDDKEEYALADEDEDSKVKSSIEVAELSEKVQATNL